jgi:hypothetical protein
LVFLSSSLMQCLLYVDGQIPGTPRCFGGTDEQTALNSIARERPVWFLAFPFRLR